MRFLSGAIALLAAALLVRPAPSVASGVAETISLFESHLHPDLPLDQFVAGRLGLIKATWSPAFRFVAYRYLAGPGFSASEQKVLVAMMNDRLGLVPPGTAVPKDGYEPTRLPGVLNPTGYDVDAAVAAWLAARNGLPGIDAIEFIDPFRPTPSAIWSFLNCNDSTFRAATTTLSEMIGKFGAESPEVQRWVAAQDQVLNNCSEKPQYPVSYSGEWSKMVDEWTAARNKIPGISAEPSFSGQCPGAAFHSAAAAVDEKIRNLTGSSPQVRRWTETLNRALAECSDSEQPNQATPLPNIPSPLTEGSLFEQAQRAYQIACANFYSGRYDEAARLFAVIAGDGASPWHNWGPYLVARATIRKATLSSDKNDLALLAQAETQLNAIVAARSDETVRSAAKRLIGFVEFRLHPQQREAEVARAIMLPDSQLTLARDLTDYLSPLGENAPAVQPTPTTEASVDDLTNWIGASEEGGQLDSAVAHWKKSASMAWLIAAIASVPGTDVNAPSLIAAAQKVKPDSPAYVTVRFHIARIMMEQGKVDESRSILDKLLAQRDTLPRSTINEISRMRLKAARNLDELLTFAQRTPLGVTDSQDDLELPSLRGWAPDYRDRLARLLAGSLLDDDGADALNRVPLSLQQRALRSPILPDDLRGQLALAAWTRAILLDDLSSARGLAPAVGKLIPELESPLHRWRGANDSRSRSFETAFFMLQHPGVRPYLNSGVGRLAPLDELDGRDNWWRTFDTHDAHSPPPNYPAFLTAEQKKSADDEWQRLSTVVAPTLMCTEVIDAARRNPDEPRIPEALNRCVRAVHLGCSNDQGTEYAKSAYSMLHGRYGKSPWAQKTRYWYKGEGCEKPM